MTRPAAVAILLALLTLLAGCTVDVQDAPQPVGPIRLGPPVPAPAPAGDGPSGTAVPVYLVRDARLEPVMRQLSGPADPTAAVTALLAGPDADEAATGISTAIPAGAPPVPVLVTGGVAVVRLPAGVERLPGPEQIISIAQVVYTVTAVPGTHSVRFTDGAGGIDVPMDSGRLVPGPVDRSDYAGLAPR